MPIICVSGAGDYRNVLGRLSGRHSAPSFLPVGASYLQFWLQPFDLHWAMRQGLLLLLLLLLPVPRQLAHRLVDRY